MGKYYRSGTFDRPTIFVCDVPGARLHVGTGLTLTRDWEMLAEMESRVQGYTPPFRRRRPRQFRKWAGKCSTMMIWNAGNIGHWFLDCLPRVHSLAKVVPTEPLTLFAPEQGMKPVQRESLEAILPPNFRLEYLPGDTWIEPEEMLWPSLVSNNCNFLLPAEYYDSIREPLFKRYGLPSRHTPTDRIYIMRKKAGWRRILNDADVIRLLTAYGFQCVDLADYSLREQVEMFHRAEIVVGAHGAGLTSLLFAGPIKLVIFYATKSPQNHYHTMAKGLGQEFHFLTDDKGEEDDFSVDVPALELILTEKFGLKR
jgi:capsular polysaccharide biosynthesis protein